MLTMPIWSKISEDCFQQLVMSQRIWPDSGNVANDWWTNCVFFNGSDKESTTQYCWWIPQFNWESLISVHWSIYGLVWTTIILPNFVTYQLKIVMWLLHVLSCWIRLNLYIRYKIETWVTVEAILQTWVISEMFLNDIVMLIVDSQQHLPLTQNPHITSMFRKTSSTIHIRT